MNSDGQKLYAEDGVDVKEEASFSSYAGSICKASYGNSHFVDVVDLAEGQFRGPRPVSFKNLPEGYLIEATTDSIGTKGVINDAAGIPETSAYDLIAMSSTDVTRFGGVPLMLINILDVVEVGSKGSPENDFYTKLMTGLGVAAKECNVVALKGETAQMGICIGSDNATSKTRYNWGATMVGAYHPDKMVTGETVAAGQKVIAIKENGFRCNGFSSVRKAFAMKYGEEYWSNPEAKEDLKAAAAPSVLSDVFINTIHGWYAEDWKAEIKLHAITHLSGGGIIEKFGNDLILKRGLSCTLDNLWEPPEIMKKCAQWRGITDNEFYEAWNGGQGILLVVDAADADKCVSRAKDYNLEAQVCGEITEGEASTLTIHSKLSDTIVVKTKEG
jgi:phosphoribosylformylglycinamidine cyclo-ligase